MLSKENLSIVENLIAQSFVDSEIEFVELKQKYEFGKLNLYILIWKKEGICLEDCVFIHNIVSLVLDNMEDFFPIDYIMNVSSSGLDRPIRTDDDFRRALDTEIEITELDEKLIGILLSYDDENIEIISGGKSPKNIIISKKNITEVQPYIRF